MSDDVQHTRWSAPGAQRKRLSELPSSPNALADVLANFLTVYGSAKARGLDISPEAEEDQASESSMCTGSSKSDGTSGGC